MYKDPCQVIVLHTNLASFSTFIYDIDTNSSSVPWAEILHFKKENTSFYLNRLCLKKHYWHGQVNQTAVTKLCYILIKQ